MLEWPHSAFSRGAFSAPQLWGLIIAVSFTAHPATSPALAEVRFAGEAGGSYRVNVMSWWEIPFRSVVRQQFDFSCGSAAVATLLKYHYNRPISERDAFAKMWAQGNREVIQKSGFSMLDMKNYLNSIGYPTEGFRVTLDQLASTDQPGIVLIDLKGFKHFVVVKGVEGGRVLVGDPMLGLGQYKLADFDKIWNGIILLIVRTPDGARPKFNLASDWGPWSTAPLDDGGLHVSIGSLTNSLPPDYQISSKMLVDVRAGTVTR
jgi:predicted double-glycine peptidase